MISSELQACYSFMGPKILRNALMFV